MQIMTEEAAQQRLFAIRANKTALDVALGDDSTPSDRLFILAKKYNALDCDESDLRYFLNYGIARGCCILEAGE